MVGPVDLKSLNQKSPLLEVVDMSKSAFKQVCPAEKSSIRFLDLSETMIMPKMNRKQFVTKLDECTGLIFLYFQ